MYYNVEYAKNTNNITLTSALAKHNTGHVGVGI